MMLNDRPRCFEMKGSRSIGLSWPFGLVVPLLVCLVMPADGALVPGTATGDTIRVAVFMPWTREFTIGPMMGSAVGLGVQEVINRTLLPNFSIEWEWKDTRCDARYGLDGLVKLRDNVDLDAIIGGGCSTVCEPVAHLAAAWNLPFVSFGCTSEALSDKTTFPTFTRTVGTWSMLAPMFDKLVEQFKWNRVGIVVTAKNIHQLTGRAIKQQMLANQKTVFYHTISSTLHGGVLDEENLAKAQTVVRLLRNQARIILLIMYDHDIRNLLLLFKNEGMINGQNVFITLDAQTSIIESEVEYPEEVTFAYEGLISANLHKPSGQAWDIFSQQVIDEFQTENKFSDVNKLAANASINSVDVHAGMLYDAVLLWAYGLNSTLQENASWIDSGVDITRNIKTTSFEGMTGSVNLNAAGDRHPNYAIQIINNGTYVSLLDWSTHSGTLVKVYKAGDTEDWTGLKWSGGATEVPSDSPICGWDGERCQPEKKDWLPLILSLVIIGVLLIIVVLAYLWYRHVKFLEDLHNTLIWKADPTDIQFSQRGAIMKQNRATMRQNKSFTALTKGSGEKTFTDIAVYKGKTVSVKKLDKHTVDLDDNKELLLELKYTRDMNHANVNQFVAVCCTSPHVSILMAYAQKGSLQDILANETINLSWDFKISISTDIVKGMIYIHQSKLGSHGHLTSSNIVIDEHWVCKITDYGMAGFKKGNRKPENYNQVSEYVWTAPELLRDGNPPVYGTQKGDVFSYGIVISELVTRLGPYRKNTPVPDASEIVRLVKLVSSTPFRPAISSDACGSGWKDMMTDCWHEDPLQRPVFSKVLERIREINGGKIMSAVDNMVMILEQHAEHLEELVATKTAEVSQEQEKVNTLLNNILPKPVADALREGDGWKPESVDAVTIFFSDIVGFSLLLESTDPAKVIEILNELYLVIDELIEIYDIHKMDMAGDAYMVVSGVPTKNGDKHASEIATMALHLLSLIQRINKPELPEGKLQMRIGIHTGPCISGVIGFKLPRYCLFGDAVFKATRVMSYSYPLKIHVSADTVNVLNKSGEFKVERRGEITVKGLRGHMETYWLLGKDNFSMDLPDLTVSSHLAFNAECPTCL